MSKFGIALVCVLLAPASLPLASPPSPPAAPADAAPAPAPPAVAPVAPAQAAPAVPALPVPAVPPVVKNLSKLPSRSVAGDDVRVEKHERVGDVSAFGGDVLILGTVEGNVHAAGGDVVVHGPVLGDIELLGGDARIDAEVSGNVKAMGGDVRLDALVRGDVMLSGGELRMGPHGKVLGKVRKQGDADAAGLLFNTAPVPSWVKRIVPGLVSPMFFLFSVLKLMAWAGVCFVALFLFWIDRLRLSAAVEGMGEDPVRTFAWGSVSAVGLLVCAILLCVTIIGIPVGLLVLTVFGAAMYVGMAVSAAALGALLPVKWLSRRPVLQIVAGTLLLAGHSLLPWLGSLIMFGAALLGLGAAVLVYRAPRAPRPLTQTPVLGAFL